MTGVRCYGNCNEDVELADEVETEFKYWSDCTVWPDEICP
jgi:hypothetical protein